MILEVRTYRLLAGTSHEFVRIMREEALPLLRRFGISAIDCGPSLAAEDGHEEAYLIRSFESITERDRQEDEFYGSEEWHSGPREAIVSRIESYHTIVLDPGPLAAALR